MCYLDLSAAAILPELSVFLLSFPFDLPSAVFLQFQCDGCTAAGVAAAAGFAEICLQFTEADTVNQSGGRCRHCDCHSASSVPTQLEGCL